MAIFNQSATSKRDTMPPSAPESALNKQPDPNEISFGSMSTPTPAPAPTLASAPARAAEREAKESIIAADLSIEGKIQGSGHVRIAGRFKGDVHVEGDLTVEVGAKVHGGVRARKVVVAGELEGNIESAQRVELLQGGQIVGDVKAGTITVAAGARMRGQVDFGFEDKSARTGKAEHKAEAEAVA
ncbi:cytoskeletal protein CcmA (bactofilin family) [Lysobacter niastensis]|uniref:Cytoskeletal protein CcmA (Bactofilin family) n=1 Tax=Lysobacter niastensis TaxID=380629 RepID=A0ABU1WEU0_9GAMM|nr:polymer-forming cytoskeletal protein [Lysobacter niastensis]MDR7136123.1 cytoskeletal protein CcmA (bactofilin family) [Lysobacter niastensis]